MVFCYLYLMILFEFGFMLFRNCVLMGLMYVGLEEVLNGFEWMVVFYVECVCGEVGLIVMGGFVLNECGCLVFGGVMLMIEVDVEWYCVVMCVVQVEGGCIVLQILYFGCYVYYLVFVVLSVLKVLINLFMLYVLMSDEVDEMIVDFV